MLNLKKITTTVSLLSLGALSVALFSTGCDNGTTSTGTGGAGGKSSVGGAGGKSSAGGAGGKSAAGGAGGTTTGTGGATGGHGGTTQAVGGHGGTAAGGSSAGGAAGSAVGGAAGSAVGGAAGGHAGSGGAAGGKGGSAAGGAGGTSAGGAGGQATTIVYNIALTGAMEVLPPGTPVSPTGMGNATVTLDTVTMLVTVAGSFSGLSSPATLAHIHGPAAVGVSANPIVTLTPSAATTGAISGSGTLTAQQVTDMRNGLTYVNVHSGAPYGGGEIRGQIQ